MLFSQYVRGPCFHKTFTLMVEQTLGALFKYSQNVVGFSSDTWIAYCGLALSSERKSIVPVIETPSGKKI